MRSPLCSFREGLKEKGEKKKVIFFLGGGGVKPHDFLVPGFGGWAACPRWAKRCECCAVWCHWLQDASCSLVPRVLHC